MLLKDNMQRYSISPWKSENTNEILIRNVTVTFISEFFRLTIKFQKAKVMCELAAPVLVVSKTVEFSGLTSQIAHASNRKTLPLNKA